MPYSLYTIKGRIESESKEYIAWLNMRQRCFNPKHTKYLDYGGRGIAVDTAWLDYNVFLKDMGRAPSKMHQLDRRDVNDNYKKENCRWATPSQQQINKRQLPANKTGITGVSWNNQMHCWVAQVCRNNNKQCLYRGLDFFAACCAIKSFTARESQ